MVKNNKKKDTKNLAVKPPPLSPPEQALQSVSQSSLNIALLCASRTHFPGLPTPTPAS